MIMCKHFIEWKELSSKRCIGSIYGNYSTLADAKLNCISDSNCKGVHAEYANMQNIYHLCYQTAKLQSNLVLVQDPESFVYTKLGINTFDACTVVWVNRI